jgi:hypothetical protein
VIEGAIFSTETLFGRSSAARVMLVTRIELEILQAYYLNV